MSSIFIGILGIISFFILIALRTPIALAMIIVGFLGYSSVTSFTAGYRIVSADIFATFSSYTLAVIPMFVWMGFLGYYTGIGTKLYSFGYKLVGHLPGGLAMASQIACAIFGAICGSSTATTATIGLIAYPEMKKYNYSDILSTSCIAAGGTLGIMIPPSVILVLYGIASGQSIGSLFLAGILPGILLTFLFIITIWVVTLRNPSWGPPSPEGKTSLKEIFAILTSSGLLEVFIVFTITFGGFFAGWFTPTEAGAVGAGGVLVVALLRKILTWEGIKKSLADTTATSAMILLLVAGATIFGRFMAITRIPFELANWAGALPFEPYIVVAIILFILLILGTFIDSLPLMLLTVPIFYPVVVQKLGYDPIWFGIIMVLVVSMGCITPPVGINVYVIRGVTNVPLNDIFRGTWAFLIAITICCALLIVFPQIATFLPSKFMP